MFLPRSSQYCDVDSDCGNPKDRCCSNLGTCHDKRGLDESCNFVVSEICYNVPEKGFCETFLRVDISRALQGFALGTTKNAYDDHLFGKRAEHTKP